MEFKFTEKDQAFYDEVDAFHKAELPPEWAQYNRAWPGGYGSSELTHNDVAEISARYMKRIIEEGWWTMSWPKEYGGMDCTVMEKAIFDERSSYYRAPAGNAVGPGMVGPTILRVGTDEQKKQWLPGIASGETTMWLGYIEPGSGSDLAGIQTSAIQDGDDYIINGQKVWSTGAHMADYAWLIARTDPDAPKHKGISFFLVDNKSPGVDIRPLVNLLDSHHFNEVYFDNVRVPAKNMVGEKNMGFYYLMTALDFERVVVAGMGGFRRVFEELVDTIKHMERDGMPLRNRQSVRRQLAEIATEIEITYLMIWKTAAMLDKGDMPSIEASTIKLKNTELCRKMADTAMDIFGPYGLLKDNEPLAPLRGLAPRGYLDAISATLGAGTSEIQRNIIATRGLGLPRV